MRIWNALMRWGRRILGRERGKKGGKNRRLGGK
jgi:hypothetical protein